MPGLSMEQLAASVSSLTSNRRHLHSFREFTIQIRLMEVD